ncbi:MAG: 3-phosphoshikimate 1-carboxyvinyltransferase [Gemmatimonadetes bacterium]|nr:3-phosphoshikimate 1-carboxyvinyltransferase [Gemmatimonadota bacterium]
MTNFEISGDISVPGDKSLTHRALMLAATAHGESVLSGLLSGADCRSTASVLRSLGCAIPEIPTHGGEIRVRSEGIQRWSAPREILDCGNSGTTSRLMMGLLAARPFCSTITGDDSLRSRPMRRITEPLTAMGARVRELQAPDRLPIELCGGTLSAFSHRSPKASAQIKSAVLLAGVSARVAVSVWEPIQSRDHTERMLRALGVTVDAAPSDGGWLVSLDSPPEILPSFEMRVPGDPSSAAFFVALAVAASGGELVIRNVGLNPTRTGFIDTVRRMGGAVTVRDERMAGGEPVGDLVVSPGTLQGIEVGAGDVPSMIDELPLLAVLATRAEGETVVRGAEELRAKESDRISAVVNNLRALGAQAEELPDGFVVTGTDAPLRGHVRTFHDHRIAMAFAVLGALPGNDVDVEDPEIVDVSFPGFWNLLASLSGQAHSPDES